MALLPEETVKDELSTGAMIQLLPKKSKVVTLTIDIGYKNDVHRVIYMMSFLQFVFRANNL